MAKKGYFSTFFTKVNNAVLKNEKLRNLKSIYYYIDGINLKFINCACEFTKKNKIKSGTSKREVVKKIIDELRRDNKYVEYNIFKSAEKVNLNTIISYQNDAIEKHFLDEYDKQ